MNNGLGSRVPFVTDKVGYRVGLDPVTLPDDPDVKEVVEGLLGQQKIPQEKYEAPTTSAQDVGWFYEPLVQPNPKFQHNLRQGDATKFAENYTLKMAGAHLCRRMPTSPRRGSALGNGRRALGWRETSLSLRMGLRLRAMRRPAPLSSPAQAASLHVHRFHGQSGKYLKF